MFWRFGFNAASAIDGVLDKENVSLEDLFEEEELLQECKAHNARLIDLYATCYTNVVEEGKWEEDVTA